MVRKIITIITSLFVMLSILPTGVSADYEAGSPLFKKEGKAVLTKGNLPLKTVENEVNSDSLEGNAHAVLTDQGEFIFIRSYDSSYEGAEDIEDIDGNVYSGYHWSVNENEAATWAPDWRLDVEKIKKVRIADGQTIRPMSTAHWFNGCKNLESIDLSNLDTSKCQNMRWMFAFCSSLESLDLSGFNTSNVTDMQSMFHSVTGLKELDLTNFNTSKVTTMTQMFWDTNLTDLDLSSFDTSNVTDMSAMFSSCRILEHLNISSFNTSKVTDMSTMFSQCSSLESLDLSNFNTSNATDMSAMFRDCEKLKQLDLSNFDTSNNIGFAAMFDGCSELTSVNLSSFNTSKADDMTAMFRSCTKLKDLDLSHFDTSNVKDMSMMFDLTGKDVSGGTLNLSSFDTHAVNDMLYMFELCGFSRIQLGSKFTVWTSSAYLPQGTWTNKAIGKSLSEKELYSQYPANASAWAGLWEKASDVPSSITLNQTELTLTPGSTVRLYATVLPENASDRSVSWMTSDSSVAKVDADGLITAVRAGTATIIAETVNGLTAACKVTVSNQAKPDPTGLELTYFAKTVNVGETLQLTSSVEPADADQTVKWSVDLKKFAEISEDGTLKGLKAGYVNVTATTVNGLRATVAIRVCFTDVPSEGKYYSTPVYWAVANGITNGYKDDDGLSRTFKPQNNCTREAVVTFLWRLAGKPNPKSMKSPFTDVQDTGKYYYKAVLWAVEKGITKGYADGTFKPNDTCLREHVVTFLYRYAGKPNPGVSKNPFNDVKSSDYYYNAALWANAKGIAKGYSDGPHAGGFGPKLDCLREHVVTFLYRYNSKYPK